MSGFEVLSLESGIKLIVGLGNPGQQYQNTRHNVGFWLVKSLAEDYAGNFKFEPKFRGFTSSISIFKHKCKLLLPETFMNLSGEAVINVVKFYKISITSILVVHDDLAFLSGVARLKKGGGANGHNGVQNIIDRLGSNDFWRLRIGISKVAFKENINNYVLSSPTALEVEQIYTAIQRAILIIPKLILGDFNAAMLELHGKVITH